MPGSDLYQLRVDANGTVVAQNGAALNGDVLPKFVFLFVVWLIVWFIVWLLLLL
jgi:hypothetical protein